MEALGESVVRFDRHRVMLTKRAVDPCAGLCLDSELVGKARFYGFGDSERRPGELAEFTKKILNITPEVFSCHYHGEMPNRVWSKVLQELSNIFT